MKIKLIHVEYIATGLVISVGFAMVLPALLLPFSILDQPILLSFEITSTENLPFWCDQLKEVFHKHKIKASVFVSGKIADQHPECVSNYPKEIDIGSMTYSYQELTSYTDYLKQLDEIKQGKLAVDAAGNLDSKLFRAPLGKTNDDIYSLLSRSNILVDFSYNDQYNKFEENQFVKYKLVTHDKNSLPKNIVPENLKKDGDPTPILISFSNSDSISEIDHFVTLLKEEKIEFTNPSEISNIPLTLSRGENLSI